MSESSIQNMCLVEQVQDIPTLQFEQIAKWGCLEEKKRINRGLSDGRKIIRREGE